MLKKIAVTIANSKVIRTRYRVLLFTEIPLFRKNKKFGGEPYCGLKDMLCQKLECDDEEDVLGL